MDQTAETAAKPAYKRILLKLSGEALMGEDSFGINRTVLARMVEEIKSVVELGVQVGIVVGGGNIFRGVALGATGMDRATGDYMGMLATVMNAMALQDACRNNGVEARVQSALNIEQVAEPYIRGKALRHLRLGRVVIFAAGTGNPFMTTDTTAALRGAEIGAEIVIKATKVDGIYTADPKKDPTATMFDEITFDDALRSNLKVMDATAFALCREQGLPIKVFNINKKGALRRVILGEQYCQRYDRNKRMWCNWLQRRAGCLILCCLRFLFLFFLFHLLIFSYHFSFSFTLRFHPFLQRFSSVYSARILQ